MIECLLGTGLKRREWDYISYIISETVVYPYHDVAHIGGIFTRRIRGKEKTYFRLHVVQGDLEIQVPMGMLGDVGVRDASGDEQLKQVFTVLRVEQIEEPSSWPRRCKANSGKLTSGDIIKVAEVIHDLTHRDANRHLSAGEERMLS